MEKTSLFALDKYGKMMLLERYKIYADNGKVSNAYIVKMKGKGSVIKKLTVRFQMDNANHRQAYETLVERNHHRYRAYADYIAPAVIAYAMQEEEGRKVTLAERYKKEIVDEILQVLKPKDKKEQEPGI